MRAIAILMHDPPNCMHLEPRLQRPGQTKHLKDQVSENRGSLCSTLNSRIFILSTPNKVPPNFPKEFSDDFRSLSEAFQTLHKFPEEDDVDVQVSCYL